MPVDLNSIKKTDLGALVAGGLALVLSLIGSYISVSVDVPDGAEGFGITDDGGGVTNAWTSYATLGMLLIAVAVALVAVMVFAPHVLPAGVPFNLVAAAAAGLGTLLVLLRALTYSESSGFGGIEVSAGPGWSGWLLFVATIALTVFAALGFKGSGEKAPWDNRNNAAYGGSYGSGAVPPAGPPQPGAAPMAPPPAAGPTPTTPPPPAPPAPGAPGDVPPSADEPPRTTSW
jgi:hypothetical protein